MPGSKSDPYDIVMIDFPSFVQTIRLDPVARAALAANDRRIIIVGAGGWLGRALTAGIFDALGEDAARERVVCFGSRAREVDIGLGRSVNQQSLDHIAELPPQPTMLFNLAFLTKDKIAGMAEADYVSSNQALSDTILRHLGPIGADRIFVASSGAAAFAEVADAAADLRLYGRLKRDDEHAFAAWAKEAPDRRALIMRIYSLAGPFINKHETYALASFILDALRGRPIEVKARGRVVRSYVAARELLSVAIMALLAESGDSITQLDSGGEAIEIGELAQLVAQRLGGRVERIAISDDVQNIYVGNGEAYERLLAKYGICPVPPAEQIAETASFLALFAGRSNGHMIEAAPDGAPPPKPQSA